MQLQRSFSPAFTWNGMGLFLHSRWHKIVCACSIEHQGRNVHNASQELGAGLRTAHKKHSSPHHHICAESIFYNFGLGIAHKRSAPTQRRTIFILLEALAISCLDPIHTQGQQSGLLRGRLLLLMLAFQVRAY